MTVPLAGSPGLAAALIAVLIAASGFFSLFDHAIRSVRKPSLLRRADEAERNAAAKGEGSPGRKKEWRRAERFRRVLAALESPGRLAAVVGFWLNSFRVAAAVLAGFVAAGPESPAAAAIFAAAMVAAILFIDHVARGAARFAPERIAAALLAPVRASSVPLIPFLFAARRGADWFRGLLPPKEDAEGMTEDELRRALLEGEKSGIVESKELAMVEGVFYLGDRPLGAFMTHRSELQWLDVNAAPDEVLVKVQEHRSQRCFPVADGALDAIIGSAFREDILLDLASPAPAGLLAVTGTARFVPETMPALRAFEVFRRGEADFLFVMDEYGGFAGMVSVWNLMEKIVGELSAPAGGESPKVEGADGSWVASGTLGIDETEEMLGLPGLSGSGEYRTLAGLVLSVAGELPSAGDSFSYRGWRFTVLDMDGNRISRVAIAGEGDEGGEA